MHGSGGGHPERRGQVILVAAIGIALTLITMGMIISALAIPLQWWSAENVESVDGVQTSRAVVEGYGSAMYSSNYQNRQGYTELIEEFKVNGRLWLGSISRIANDRGRTVNATVQSTTNGTTIGQKHLRNITSKNGAASDWDIVKDSAKVRRFTMNITFSNLTKVDDGIGGDDGEDDADGADPFKLILDTGTETTVFIYHTGDPSVATITVMRNGNEVGETTIDGSYVVLDLTEHTIAGNKTPWFPGVSPPYSVRVENGHNAGGRYILVTNRTYSQVQDSRYHDACLIESPCVEPAIYSSIVRAESTSARVDFGTNLLVAPEDPGLRFPELVIQHRVTFYNQDTGLSSISNNTSTVDSHVTDIKPQFLGSAKYDLNHAGKVDVPYLDNSDNVRLVDIASGGVENGDTLLLRKGGKGVKTELIGVGDYDEDGYPEIYYNEDDDIYKVNAIPADTEDYQNATLVRKGSNLGGSNDLQGIAGIGDVDDDGDVELVYTTDQKELKYVDKGQPPVLMTTGLAQGDAVGAPADFDMDGTPRVPVVKQNNGKNHIHLIGVGVPDIQIAKQPVVKPSPLAPSDIDRDGELEVVFADQESELSYVNYNTTLMPNVPTYMVVDTDNDSVSAKKEKGAR